MEKEWEKKKPVPMPYIHTKNGVHINWKKYVRAIALNVN